jgi:hypothetical protein
MQIAEGREPDGAGGERRMICGECDAHYESHEQYAGKPLHTGYCNKMMQNVNKWDRCLYEPKEVQP